ncbi:hypothetical protein KR018_009496 [Drosophila ironensis]|nr:hypothetical protein KR018_009496 [Drosophila ironensis]
MTSFRKRAAMQISGTRTSQHTAQVITSFGNPYLDVVIGGGLALGSICLIEEDRFTTHAKVLAKYFMAEGVVTNHEIFLGSLDDVPSEMLRRLPAPIIAQFNFDGDEVLGELGEEKRAVAAFGDDAETNGLRIAWRYNDLPLVNSNDTQASIGHHFNLMEPMSACRLKAAMTKVWDGTEAPASPPSIVVADDEPPKAAASPTPCLADPLPPVQLPAENATAAPLAGAGEESSQAEQPPQEEANNNERPKVFHNSQYAKLLDNIHKELLSECFAVGTTHGNVLRVCLTSLGSPLWYGEHFGEDLIKFLTVLRATLRNRNSVCLITMPMHLIAKYDASLVPKIRQLVDYAIELESFAGSEKETHPAFKEYSGLLHLHKMSALNTLAVHMPDTTDLAFKLRRKKFILEKLHLPPELEESSPQSKDKCHAGGVLGNSNAAAALDF